MLKLICIYILIDIFLVCCCLLAVMMRGSIYDDKLKIFLTLGVVYATSGSLLIALIRPGVLDDVTTSQFIVATFFLVIMLYVTIVNSIQMLRNYMYSDIGVIELVKQYIILANLPSIGKLDKVVYKCCEDRYQFHGEYGRLEISVNKPWEAWVYVDSVVIGKCCGGSVSPHYHIGRALIHRLNNGGYPVTKIN